MLKTPVAAPLLALVLAVLPGGGPATSAPADPVAAVHLDRAKGKPRLAPGRFGKAKIGMSVRRTLATGYFRATPDDLCGQRASFTKRWLERGLGSYVYDTGLKAISVDKPKIRTDGGARVGMTLDEVRARHTDLVGPYEEQWISGPETWAHVQRGNRYLTFFMSGPAATDTVSYIGVSKGQPGGFGAGC